MEEKKTSPILTWFVSLVSFSFTILYPAGGAVSLLFPILLIITGLFGGSLYIRRRYVFVQLLVVISVNFMIQKIISCTNPWFGVPSDCIDSITGYVIYDSSFTQSGNHFMTVFIKEAGSVFDQTVSAGGLINVIGKERAIISSGIKITLNGKFSDGLFKYESIQVLSRSTINDIREFLITEIEKRVSGGQFSDASILSMMLILGRADDHQSIKQAAQDCGCSHVLALSGMHLNTLGLIFKPVKNRYLKYFFTVLISSVFVFIAGPRPSLIRAYLMLILSFLPTVERILTSFILQTVLFPFTIINTGCVFSYLAIFALTFIVPTVTQVFPYCKTLVTSACVLLLIAPVDLYMTGTWHPAAILLSPIVGVLITVSMFLGFSLMILGSCKPLVFANEFLFTLLQNIFNRFGFLPAADRKDYLIFASIMIAFLICIPLSKLLLRQRFKKINKTPIIYS